MKANGETELSGRELAVLFLALVSLLVASPFIAAAIG